METLKADETRTISGIVLYFDIVGFTKNRDIPEQKDIILNLTKFVTESCKTSIEQGKEIVISSSGDGLAVAFNANLGSDLVLSYLDMIANWSTECSVRLRCGIHVDTLLVYKGINDINNFCGRGVNMAKRVMDAGEDHFLCSSTAYEQIGAKAFRKKNWNISEPKVYYTKHKNRVHVRNIWKNEIGNEENPYQYISEKFIYGHKGIASNKKQDDIINAKYLCCVAITGIGLIRLLTEYSYEYSEVMKGKTVEIYLPKREILRVFLDQQELVLREEEYDESMKTFQHLEQRSKEVGFNVRLLLCKYFPTYGVLGFDYDMKEDQMRKQYNDSVSVEYVEHRKIRVVWYIWGEDSKISPFAEFYHPGDGYLGGSEYEMFKRAIDYLKKCEKET